MPELTEEQKNLVTQFQLYQQQLQSIIIQKENLKLQLTEIDKSLEELNTTKKENAYKIIGNIMVVKPVVELKNELKEKKETLDVRLKSLQKVEERVTNKLKELQEKVSKFLR